MGAGGSTAASCSSLDAQARRHYRANNEQHLLLERKMQRQQLAGGQQDAKRRNMKHSTSYLDLTYLSSAPAWPEGYSLTNSNFQVARPIRVLPVEPAPVCQLKKSNAGVASRIQQQRQQRLLAEQACKPARLSDSLPSLNNIMVTGEHQHQHHQQQQISQRAGKLARAANANFTSPLTGSNQSASSSGKQTVAPCCQAHLVSRESPGQPLNQLMKRATSLSSLHNLHNNNNNHHHRQQQQQPNSHHHQCGDNGASKQTLLGSQSQPASSSGSNKQEPVNHKQGYPRSSQYRAAREQRRPHSPAAHSSQQVKRPSRYKQQAPKPPTSHYHSRRYRQSPQQPPVQQQQQPPPPPQQRPVLPPLPRSQSLHELVQLRATENGQRMRNTGTLRGALGQPADKVNLVAELLESRRRKQQATDSTLASQCSSTDDGVHSIKADQLPAPKRPPGGQSRRLSQQAGAAELRPTLKRSASHSALSQPPAKTPTGNLRGSHDSNINDDDDEEDEDDDDDDQELDADESDDLNELAKFLYQFKQRQAAADRQPVIAEKPAVGGEQAVALAKPAQLQQSPNSTTSSSGFASSASTCQSHSISSDEGARQPSKCAPISGKLKLSSSLLSIVDEYQSTLQAGKPAAELASRLQPTDQVAHSGRRRPEEQISNLEQLKRYTQLRQLSQSELALNQLAGTKQQQQQQQQQPPVAAGPKSKRPAGEQAGKQYKSKLISLIRRISDKSEADNGSRRPAGGPINQVGLIAASETGADLNFDCDLELIRRCTGSKQSKRACQKPAELEQPRQLPVGGPSKSSDANNNNNTNWRLVPSALLHAKPARQPPANEKPAKLKWSPSGWLMSRSQGGSASSSDGAKQPKAAKGANRSRKAAPQAEPDQVLAAIVSLAKVNSEASQLLDELDQSLDLVSSEPTAPFSRKAALGWLEPAQQHSDFEFQFGNEEEEDDDEDQLDYASLNRAMIKATFAVEPASQLERPPSSPSGSFTFSAPSSPAAVRPPKAQPVPQKPCCPSKPAAAATKQERQVERACCRRDANLKRSVSPNDTAACCPACCRPGAKQPAAVGRSNSELLARQVAEAGKLAGHRREQQQFLFGKLRSSLLSAQSNKGAQTRPASGKQQLLGKLANGSQVSLASYALASHLVSPLVFGANSRLLAANNYKSSSSSPSQLDDNFILRRKTPNAGLKSHS